MVRLVTAIGLVVLLQVVVIFGDALLDQRRYKWCPPFELETRTDARGVTSVHCRVDRG